MVTEIPINTQGNKLSNSPISKCKHKQLNKEYNIKHKILKYLIFTLSDE